MGGAIGTPLLLLVILLLIILMCVIKRNGSTDNDEIVMHSNEIYNIESRILDEGQKTSVLNSPQDRPSDKINDIEEVNIYASVQ